MCPTSLSQLTVFTTERKYFSSTHLAHFAKLHILCIIDCINNEVLFDRLAVNDAVFVLCYVNILNTLKL